MMEEIISRFVCNLIQLNVMFFPALYILRDGLRMPLGKIVVYGELLVLAGNLFITVLYANLSMIFLSLLGIAALTAGYALLLFRATHYERGKVLLVLLLVVSYVYFAMNLGNPVCILFGLPIFGFTYSIAAVFVGITLLPLYPFLRFMNWLWLRIRDLRDTSWYRLCLVPAGFIVMGAVHWEFFLAGMIAGAAFPVFQLTIIVMAFVIYWQIADSLSKTADAAQLAERLRNVDNQLLLQAEFLQEATAHEGEIRQIRHDMRHHFAALESMLDKTVNERAIGYLREYIDKVEDSVMPPVCKNTVANAVLRRYMTLAEAQNVQTDVAADIPEELGVADGDLAVLLSNLLENALEACKRQSTGQRYIKLRAKTTGNSLMLSISNSFDGVIRSHADKDGEPVLLSLKRGGTEEGIGLASIRTIVGRYNGLHELDYDAEMFSVKVLLYVEQN